MKKMNNERREKRAAPWACVQRGGRRVGGPGTCTRNEEDFHSSRADARRAGDLTNSNSEPRKKHKKRREREEE